MSIRCWDSNPRPSERESPSITTRLGLLLNWGFSRHLFSVFISLTPEKYFSHFLLHLDFPNFCHSLSRQNFLPLYLFFTWPNTFSLKARHNSTHKYLVFLHTFAFLSLTSSGLTKTLKNIITLSLSFPLFLHLIVGPLSSCPYTPYLSLFSLTKSLQAYLSILKHNILSLSLFLSYLIILKHTLKVSLSLLLDHSQTHAQRLSYSFFSLSLFFSLSISYCIFLILYLFLYLSLPLSLSHSLTETLTSPILSHTLFQDHENMKF